MLDARTVARAYGATRVLLGVAMALFPKTTKPWIGRVADHADVHGPLRVLGVRDALLGVTVLGTPDGSEHRRGALALCALADGCDAAVTLADFARTKRVGAALAAVTATGGMAVGLWARTQSHG